MSMELELLKAGIDSVGDTITLECLKGMVKDFKPGQVPVTVGFDPRAVPVGNVTALRLDGERVMATLVLNGAGKFEVAKAGVELASGGKFETGGGKPPFTINSFELTGAALTDKKVK